MVQKFCPTERKHLADFTALARPGTLDFNVGSFASDLGQSANGNQPLIEHETANEKFVSAASLYMDVKNGRSDPTYLHPDLEPILSETYSVAVYQEQIMSILTKIGGFSGEEADIIRSAIAKKKKDVIQSTFSKLRDGATSRGWTKEKSDSLCKMVEAFSRYSFNKSHSYAYAELGYITMYLKHHHPLEWWTSVLNSAIDEEDKLRKFVGLLGDMLCPPSLKSTASRFAIDNGKIRAPLSVIKGVGGAAVEQLQLKAPFANLEDYLERVDQRKVHIGVMSALIRSRAADSLMDQNLPYPEARKKFLDDFRRLRSSKSEFDDAMYKLDPISIFLAEQESNTCFNKHLLTDPEIREELRKMWPGLKSTGKPGIPFLLGSVPILASVRVAQGFIQQDSDKEFGMILLYDSSAARNGVSKKSGKPWSLTSLKLSDGYSLAEAILWDHDKPLKWRKNSIVYVRGKLKSGWKIPVSITVAEIEKIEEESKK